MLRAHLILFLLCIPALSQVSFGSELNADTNQPASNTPISKPRLLSDSTPLHQPDSGIFQRKSSGALFLKYEVAPISGTNIGLGWCVNKKYLGMRSVVLFPTINHVSNGNEINVVRTNQGEYTGEEKISDRFFGLQIGPTVPVTYWFHLYAVAEFNWAAEFRKPVYDKNHNHLGYFYPFHQGSIGYEMGTQLHLFRAHLSAGWNSASRGVSLSLGFVNWL